MQPINNNNNENPLTIKLRPATKEEVTDHYQSNEEQNIFKKSWSWISDNCSKTYHIGHVFLSKNFLTNLEKSVHDDPYLSLHKMYPKNFYLTGHPEVMKTLLSPYRNDESEDSYYRILPEDCPITIKLIQEILEDDTISIEENMILASREKNLEHRLALFKFFSQGKINKRIPEISEIVERTIEDWSLDMLGNNEIPITQLAKGYATTVMSKLFLGFEGPYHELCSAVDTILLYLVKSLTKQSLSKEFLVKLEESKTILRTCVEESLTQAQESQEPASLVKKLLEEKSEQETKVITFILFLAGQENTASLINYSLLKIAQDKELQNSIREEIEAIKTEENCATAEAANQSKLIHAVLKESLRMQPPVYTLGRFPGKDLILDVDEQSYFIEKESRINPCPHFAGRHPSIAIDTPDTFDYTRWNEININDYPTNYEWLPFGYGPHKCPGWRLAYLETKILIAKLLERFELDTTIKGEPKQVGLFTTTTKNPVYISLSEIDIVKYLTE